MKFIGLLMLLLIYHPSFAEDKKESDPYADIFEAEGVRQELSEENKTFYIGYEVEPSFGDVISVHIWGVDYSDSVVVNGHIKKRGNGKTVLDTIEIPVDHKIIEAKKGYVDRKTVDDWLKRLRSIDFRKAIDEYPTQVLDGSEWTLTIWTSSTKEAYSFQSPMGTDKPDEIKEFVSVFKEMLESSGLELERGIY